MFKDFFSVENPGNHHTLIWDKWWFLLLEALVTVILMTLTIKWGTVGSAHLSPTMKLAQPAKLSTPVTSNVDVASASVSASTAKVAVSVVPALAATKELDEHMLRALREMVAVGARPGEGVIAFTRRVSGSLPGLHLGLRSLNLKETIALAHEYGASVTIYLDGSDSSPTIEAPTLAVGTEPGWRLELVDSEIRVDGSVSKPPSFALGHWKKFPR